MTDRQIRWEFRTLRRAAGLTQRDLGRLLKVDDSVVGLWELGHRQVPEYRIAELAAIFGLSRNDMARRLDVRESVEITVATKPEPLAVSAFRDSADPYSWTRLDAEACDARRRYDAWAAQEVARLKMGRQVRATAGATRYAPSYEGICMGPSVRCHRGHYACRSTHEGAA